MRSLVLAVTILLVAPAAAEAAGVLVFTSGRDGARYEALHTVDSTGHSLRELQPGLSATSWTQSGNRVVLVQKKDDRDEFVVVDATGARSVFAVGVDVYNYEWSPSGDAIAFDTLPANASHVTVLDTGTGRTSDLGLGRYPAWSPDGRRIGFVRPSTSTRGFALWTARRDGSSARNVTDTSAMVGGFDGPDFRWSPDSKRVAYLQYDRLYVAAVDGSAPKLISGWTDDIRRVSWSRDGKRLAFEVRGRTSEGARLGTVYVADRDGGGRRRLLTVARGVWPVWAPRGNDIAVTLQSPRDDKLFLVHRDGRGRRLVLSNAVVERPVWSADGTTLAVAAGEPLDIWAIDTRLRDKVRVTQGERYGYANSPVRWLSAGVSESVLPGQAVGPELAVDSVVEGGVLKARRPIHQLAADGQLVAVHYDRRSDYDPTVDFRCFDLWDVDRGSVSRFPMGACGGIVGCCSLGAGGFVDFALAGDRLAFNGFTHFAGLDIFDLYTVRVTQPLPRLVGNVCPDNRYGDCLIPEADLEGDGSLLVFDTWESSCQYPSYPTPCAVSPKRNGKLWRLDGERAALVASSSGALTPRGVDAGRILVDHQDGTLELLRDDGRSLGSFQPVPGFRDADLQGLDIVVFGDAGLAHYDAATFGRQHLWPLGCGDPTQTDLHGGVAVYVCGNYVHVVRLADGSDVALLPLGTDPRIQLEAAGLYYAYSVADASYPGRVSFIPFADLP